jgi:hypothetical protein
VPTKTKRIESWFLEAGGNIEMGATEILPFHLEQLKLGRGHSIDID